MKPTQTTRALAKRTPIRLAGVALLTVVILMVSSGCAFVEQIVLPERESARRQFPGVPDDWVEAVEILADLDLPDLSSLPDLPQLDALPVLESIPGGIVFRGPVQQTIAAGETVPGTDIILLRTDDNVAVFTIAGLRSERRIGDSLDFDGEWPGIDGSTYSSRFRIYQIGDGRVRVAGVQQLGIPEIAPMRSDSRASVSVEDKTALRFPFVASVEVDESIPGTSFRYAGAGERGAEMSGMADHEYRYFKAGDSLSWIGLLRDDVPAAYSLRTIHYDDNALRVGGVVTVQLPVQDGS